MGLPDIVIEFSRKAVAAIQSGTLGVVGIILKDDKNNGAMILRGVDEIPTGDSAFSAANTAYIQRAFIGAPTKVIVYTLPQDAEDYNEAFKYFATQRVHYMVGAPDISTDEAKLFATWIKGLRAKSIRRPVAVSLACWLVWICVFPLPLSRSLSLLRSLVRMMRKWMRLLMLVSWCSTVMESVL